MTVARRTCVTVAALALTIAGTALAGCTEVEEASSEGYQPAKVEGLEDAEVKRVTFTEEAVARIGLRTATVRRSGTRTVVPSAALIYDEEGEAYVYTSPKPRSFVREEVEVDRVEGGRALLSDGPPVGTPVVTVGAAEVLGAELEIAGGH
jgi:hypothetical protein